MWEKNYSIGSEKLQVLVLPLSSLLILDRAMNSPGSESWHHQEHRKNVCPVLTVMGTTNAWMLTCWVLRNQHWDGASAWPCILVYLLRTVPVLKARGKNISSDEILGSQGKQNFWEKKSQNLELSLGNSSWQNSRGVPRARFFSPRVPRFTLLYILPNCNF